MKAIDKGWCRLCGSDFDQKAYNFPDTKYKLCHVCYGKLYDNVCNAVLAQRKRDRGRVTALFAKYGKKLFKKEQMDGAIKISDGLDKIYKEVG